MQVWVHVFLTQVKPDGQEPPGPHAGKSKLGKNVQVKAENRPHTLPPPNFLWQKQSGWWGLLGLPQGMVCPPPEQSKPCPLQGSVGTHWPFWQVTPSGQPQTPLGPLQQPPGHWLWGIQVPPPAK